MSERTHKKKTPRGRGFQSRVGIGLQDELNPAFAILGSAVFLPSRRFDPDADVFQDSGTNYIGKFRASLLRMLVQEFISLRGERKRTADAVFFGAGHLGDTPN